MMNKPSAAQSKVIKLMRSGSVLLMSSPAGKWFLNNGDITDQTARALVNHKLIEPYNWLIRGLMEYTLTDLGKTIQLITH
jgi:hypothetical protein